MFTSFDQSCAWSSAMQRLRRSLGGRWQACKSLPAMAERFWAQTRRRRIKGLAKEELLTIEGVIDEILPDGRFGVVLDNECRIIAYTAGKMRRFRIRSIVGDRVHVEMTPYDLSKGRIVYREKVPGTHPGAKRRQYRR
jgi:translation initiation factor IF-1